MNSEFEYPDFVARFYDVVYDHIRTGVDNSFYLRKIAETKAPVLEIGVGTGRFFMEALEAGADIYGIDISQHMIGRLKQKLDNKYHHRVSVKNILNYTSEKKYKLVIAPFRMFSHLTEVEMQLKALNHIYDILSENGLFIFDVYVPDPLMISRGIDHVKDFEGEYEPGKKVTRTVFMKADIVKQISKVNMKFDWDENGEKFSKDWDFDMRFFFRYELEHLVGLSKFRLEKICGDFLENELNAGSKEFVVFCRKDH